MDLPELRIPDESGSWPAVTLAGVGCKVLQDAVDGLASTVDDFTARIAEYEGTVMQRTRKILVIDDEPSTRTALLRCLQDERTEVIVAATGEEAVAELAAHAFDLLMVDLNLGGGMTGMDVVEHARAQNEVVPIVLVSGLHPDEVARLARQCRANAALAKPCDVDVLAATVGRLLDRRRD